MSDIKLFSIIGNAAKVIQGTVSHLEKPLQYLIEENLAPWLGIRFLATEYPTGKTHAGCIDTLGLDENDSLVIIEIQAIKPREYHQSRIVLFRLAHGSQS
jgi:RecB family endonuclease NucS